MRERDLQRVQKKLVRFVEHFRPELGRSERRHWCGMYLSGLMLDGERKSIQPLAERLRGGNEQALQQFVNQSPWAFEPVQEKLGPWLMERLGGGKSGWLVLDDTAFPKKGNHSVGVAHQYCGALGKQANCQVLVSWHWAGKVHFPLRGELYLPESWARDRKRRTHAGVPLRRGRFQTKWKLALQLLDTFRETTSASGVLCDAGYGQIKPFLHALDERKLPFMAQIPGSMSFWPAEVPTQVSSVRRGRPAHFAIVQDSTVKPFQAQVWARQIPGDSSAWTRVTLPHQRRTVVEVAACRVREVDNGYWRRPGKERWLLVEKRGTEFKYYLSSLPETTPVANLVITAHERWKVEQGYQQLKEELGLDHFEGRGWLGFHHHVTLCFLAYAFLLLLQHPHGKKNGSSRHSQPSVAGSTI
ncbi:MAG: IS701 family transposase [Pseudomonadota bacterium]